MRESQYHIRVRGRLPEHWARTFLPLESRPGPEGTTELRGPLPDPAALSGVLARLGDLGVELVSVRCPEADRGPQ
jgi:hypothetical protein